MKILILNQNTEGKGTYFRCYWFAKYLVKSGHSVTLICLQKERSLRITIRRAEGIRIILLPRISDSGFKELPAHISRAIMITTFTVFNNYDIVHSFSVASPTTGLPIIPFWFLKKIHLKKYKLVVDWDDWWGKGGLTTHSNQGMLIEEVATLLEEKIPILADRVTTGSSMLFERAISVGVKRENLLKIGNGSNVEYIKLLDKNEVRMRLGLNDQFTFCFAGSILVNFEFLLKAFNELKKKTPEKFNLIVISQLEENHFKLIEKYNLKNEILYLGRVPYDNLIEYLGASDVLLLPRSNNLLDKCEFPARLGDYMASGRAILSNSVGEVESLLFESQSGLLADADDFENFCENALKLMSDKFLCEELGRNGRFFAENKFSWKDLTTHLIEDVYL
ncbi:MAG: glycosyltransferase family 4 protein [Halobacteriota archaeon]|nr:glycosyltransferase family 4 protein [Halobacteriota archaeon]